MTVLARDGRRVSVLFAHRRSAYFGLPVDVYDERRDAGSFVGLGPVIAHPPCRLWCRLRAFSTAPEAERGLAFLALHLVRSNGGVLEHPAHSSFWDVAGLPRGNGERDAFGGWTLAVSQKWWGHRAEKLTWLYIVGCGARDIPELPYSILPASHSCGRSRKRSRPSIEKAERDLTPAAFCWWLEELASRCSAGSGGRDER